jgi:hypothetical protein
MKDEAFQELEDLLGSLSASLIVVFAEASSAASTGLLQKSKICIAS